MFGIGMLIIATVVIIIGIQGFLDDAEWEYKLVAYTDERYATFTKNGEVWLVDTQKPRLKY